MGKTRRYSPEGDSVPVEHRLRRRDIGRASRDIAKHTLALMVEQPDLCFEIEEVKPDEEHSREQIYEILQFSAEKMVELMYESSATSS